MQKKFIALVLISFLWLYVAPLHVGAQYYVSPSKQKEKAQNQPETKQEKRGSFFNWYFQNRKKNKTVAKNPQQRQQRQTPFINKNFFENIPNINQSRPPSTVWAQRTQNARDALKTTLPGIKDIYGECTEEEARVYKLTKEGFRNSVKNSERASRRRATVSQDDAMNNYVIQPGVAKQIAMLTLKCGNLDL